MSAQYQKKQPSRISIQGKPVSIATMCYLLSFNYNIHIDTSVYKVYNGTTVRLTTNDCFLATKDLNIELTLARIKM